MYQKDEHTLNRLTLKQLSELININRAEAMTKSLKLRWGFKQSYIHARIEKGGVTIFEEFYQGKLTHLHLCEMHIDFYNQMLKYEKPSYGNSGRP